MASQRSNAVGVPPRWTCPRTTARASLPVRSSISEASRAGEDGYLAFLRAALHGRRTDCAVCGHADAIVGYAHRNAVGGPPCFALGPRGVELPKGWVDIVFPDRAPGAATLDSSG